MTVLLSFCWTMGCEWVRRLAEGSGAYFDQGPDDAEGGEAEILERTGLGGGVEEGIEEEGNVG
jgi:hypothetical protein